VTTKTKPEERVGELEERLSELEQQRRQAADAITLAEQRTEEIATRQQQIAVAVVSEDAEAVAENEQLEEALLIERRRAATAKSAAQQLDALIAGAKEDLAADKRRGHLEAAAQLAHERYDLEAQAKQEMRLLLKTLCELEHLDRRHCQELRAGGLQTPTEPLGWMVEAWLLTRLAEWVSENPRHQGFAAKDLPELDGLASKATPEGA
jgi:predicted Zn-dependent protease